MAIAHPDFDYVPDQISLVPHKFRADTQELQTAGKDIDWKPLPDFGILGKSIASKLNAEYYEQQTATKSVLTGNKCPHILSILTHGLGEGETDADELDPMKRSGLAFSGANHSTEHLLLANEVATLDLHRNELTLLVACETALGDMGVMEYTVALELGKVNRKLGNLRLVK